MACPVLTFLLLHAPGPSATPTVAAPTAIFAPRAAAPHHLAAHLPAPLVSSEVLNLFVALWFAGVLLFSLRTAGGFIVVARLRRRDSHPVNARLLTLGRELQQRLGVTRAVRFCESLHLDAPAVLGWFRPVVFLPVSILTGLSETQLRAVIAHELAHIRRFDAFFNLFQVAAETLLFYHPTVWWLSKCIRVERENCCDDVALAVCGNPAEYARALALMEESRVAPSFAMAANRGPLAARVARLLGLGEKGNRLRNAGVAFGILCVATALIAGNALFGIVHPVSAKQEPTVQPPSDPAVEVTAPRPTPVPQAKLSPSPRTVIHGRLAAEIRGTIQENLRAGIQQGIQQGIQKSVQSGIQGGISGGIPNGVPSGILGGIHGGIQGGIQEGIQSAIRSAIELRIRPFIVGLEQQKDEKSSAKSQSYIDGLKAEGFDNLSADDLIGMKVQGITPQYIHEIRAQGLKPSIDDLIGMKVQGITPEYIRQMRALKLNTDVDSLIGMKVQGITPEYVDQIRKLGFQGDSDQLIGMKVQGVTPDYVNEMRKLGFQPDADQLIGMKVQGINAEYIKQINDLGLHPDADDLIGMKVQGINAEYIRSIRSTGLNPDKDDLIGMKVQGVTADYIKALQAAGFKPDVEDVIGAKVQGVTPEFIKQAQGHGFKNLDLQKIIQLKLAGVLE